MLRSVVVAACIVGVASDIAWREINAGESASCAVDTNGQAYCAGAPLQSGLPAGGSVMQPVAVGLSFSSISVGAGHVAGVLTNGSVVSWGRGGRGQLGDGRGVDSMLPVLALTPPGLRFTAVSAGNAHTVALAINGTIYAWGAGNNGQLGYGDIDDQLAPVQVLPGTDSGDTSNYTMLTAGGWHSCAIDTAGYLLCWGSDAFGQVGQGSGGDALVPRRVAPSFNTVSGGKYHTCGISADGGRTYCWGRNDAGQCGLLSGPGSPVMTPVEVSYPKGVTGFVNVQCGEAHTVYVAVMDTAPPTQTTYTVGSNDSGQCGTGSTSKTSYTELTQITAGDTFSNLWWSQVDAGYRHNCGVDRSSGSVACWGLGSSGQLGDGQTANVYAVDNAAIVVQPSATPTATSTATGTSTATATATSTSSSTATSSLTASPSISSTSTSTGTATSTASASSTSTRSPSSTITATTTSTATRSASASSSSTGTSSASPSASLSSSASPSGSVPAAFAPFVGLPVIPQYGSWIGIFIAGSMFVVVGAQCLISARHRAYLDGGDTGRYLRIMGSWTGRSASVDYTPLPTEIAMSNLGRPNASSNII